MSGLAAMLLVARTELGDPNAGQTTENLDSITAVVLGGTSLFGGRGSIIGTLIGAVIVGVFRNGLTLIGVQVIYQYLVTGVLVILAVSVDQLVRRRAAVSDRPPADSRGARDRQALRARRRAERRRLRALPGRDPRDHRRQRSRQVDAYQGALGRAPARTRARSSSTGTAFTFRSPRDARRAGIETVYQELAVAPALDIAANIFLGRELRRGGLLGSCCGCSTKAQCVGRQREHFSELQIGVRSIAQAVETLSGGQRQGVAVARAAAWARRVVIMDEPTAALGVKETRSGARPHPSVSAIAASPSS